MPSALDPHISIATVYRTVRLLEEKGILERRDFGGGRARYEPSEHGKPLPPRSMSTPARSSSSRMRTHQQSDPGRSSPSVSATSLVSHRLELFGRRSAADQAGRAAARARPAGKRPGETPDESAGRRDVRSGAVTVIKPASIKPTVGHTGHQARDAGNAPPEPFWGRAVECGQRRAELSASCGPGNLGVRMAVRRRRISMRRRRCDIGCSTRSWARCRMRRMRGRHGATSTLYDRDRGPSAGGRPFDLGRWSRGGGRHVPAGAAGGGGADRAGSTTAQRVRSSRRSMSVPGAGAGAGAVVRRCGMYRGQGGDAAALAGDRGVRVRGTRST